MNLEIRNTKYFTALSLVSSMSYLKVIRKYSPCISQLLEYSLSSFKPSLYLLLFSTVNLTKDHTSLLHILHYEQCFPGLSCYQVFLNNSQPLAVTSSWRRRAWCRTWKYLKVPQLFNHCISHISSFIARFFLKKKLHPVSPLSLSRKSLQRLHTCKYRDIRILS